MVRRWSVTTRWIGRRRFEGDGPTPAVVPMDTRPESGGEGSGPTPMETVLIALGGCTGMDVVGILEKMRAPLEGLTITVTGERAETHPKVFTRIHTRYEAWGKGLTAAQVGRAVHLSQEKYCSVAAMLRATATLTHEIAVVDRPPVRP